MKEHKKKDEQEEQKQDELEYIKQIDISAELTQAESELNERFQAFD